MIRLFKHYIPHAVLLLGLIDFALLLLANDLAWKLRAEQIGTDAGLLSERMPALIGFAVVTQTAMIAVGIFGSEALRSLRFAGARLLVGVSLAVLLLAFVEFILPGETYWRSTLLYAMILALVLLFANRVVVGGLLGANAFRRRVLVLGAGPRALRLGALSERPGSGFAIVGYVSMGGGHPAFEGAIPRAAIPDLSHYVQALGASEVVLALEERRNALPLKDLLRIKTAGVHVNDFSSFMERETGRVDLDTLNPSWLIFSDGFSSGRMISSSAKRVFDILASGLLLLLTFPVIGLFAILVKLDSKGPAFFRQTARRPLRRAVFESSSSARCAAMPRRTAQSGPRRTIRASPGIGQVHPQGPDRRTAAGLERAQGPYELCRPAAGSAPVRRRSGGTSCRSMPSGTWSSRASPAGRRSTIPTAPRSRMRGTSWNTISITPRTTRRSSTC